MQPWHDSSTFKKVLINNEPPNEWFAGTPKVIPIINLKSKHPKTIQTVARNSLIPDPKLIGPAVLFNDEKNQTHLNTQIKLGNDEKLKHENELIRAINEGIPIERYETSQEIHYKLMLYEYSKRLGFQDRFDQTSIPQLTHFLLNAGFPSQSDPALVTARNRAIASLVNEGSTDLGPDPSPPTPLYTSLGPSPSSSHSSTPISYAPIAPSPPPTSYIPIAPSPPPSIPREEEEKYTLPTRIIPSLPIATPSRQKLLEDIAKGVALRTPLVKKEDSPTKSLLEKTRDSMRDTLQRRRGAIEVDDDDEFDDSPPPLEYAGGTPAPPSYQSVGYYSLNYDGKYRYLKEKYNFRPTGRGRPSQAELDRFYEANSEEKEREEKYGDGIRHIRKGAKKLNFIPFGDKEISKDLLKDSILSIRMPNGKKISSCKNREISRSLKNAILDALRGEFEHETLDEDDQLIYDRLLHISKVRPQVSDRVKKNNSKLSFKNLNKSSFGLTTKQAAIRRLKVLIGQTASGNDNPDIQQEIRMIGDYLKGKIPLHVLEQIKSITE